MRLSLVLMASCAFLGVAHAQPREVKQDQAIASLNDSVTKLKQSVADLQNLIKSINDSNSVLSKDIEIIKLRLDVLGTTEEANTKAIKEISDKLKIIEDKLAAQPQKPNVVLNLSGPDYYNRIIPTLNALNTSPTSIRTNRADLPDSETNKDGDYFTYGIYDSKTYLPLEMGRFSKIHYGTFLASGQDWIVDWSGDASIDIEGCEAEKTVFDSRIELKTYANSGLCTVVINDIKSPITSLRAYLSSEKDLIDSGKIYRPDYIKDVSSYGALRCANFLGIGANNAISPAEIKPVTSVSWGVGNAGLEPMACLALAVEAGNIAWISVPPFMGASSDIKTAFREPEDAASRKAVLSSLGALVSQSPDADEFSTYADYLVSQIVASGYPANRPLWIELGDQIYATDKGHYEATSYYTGLGDGLRPGEGPRYASGYMSAKLQQSIKSSLAKIGRTQSFRIIINNQLTNPDGLEYAFDGISDYFNSKSLDLKSESKNFGVSTSVYVFDGVSGKKFIKPESGVPYRDTVISYLNSTPDFTSKLADWFTSSQDEGSINHVLNLRKRHIDIAAKYGIEYIADFSSGEHAMGYPDGFDLNADEDFKYVNELFRLGNDSYRVAKLLMFEEMKQAPKAMVADFQLGSFKSFTNLDMPVFSCDYHSNCGRHRAVNELLGR